MFNPTADATLTGTAEELNLNADATLTGTAEELNLNATPVPNPKIETDYWMETGHDDMSNVIYTKVKLLEYSPSFYNYPYDSYAGHQKIFNYKTGKHVEREDGHFYKQDTTGKCLAERTNLATCLRIPGGKNKRAKSIKRKSIKSKRKSQKKNQKTNRGRRNSIKHK